MTDRYFLRLLCSLCGVFFAGDRLTNINENKETFLILLISLLSTREKKANTGQVGGKKSGERKEWKLLWPVSPPPMHHTVNTLSLIMYSSVCTSLC